MKPTVYMLHGWTYDLTAWQPFINALGSRGIAARLLKTPGLTKPTDHPWTTGDYVAWLHEAVSGGEKPVTILGHSNGGRIALWYAAIHPERVSKLILIGSAGVPRTGLSIRIRRMVFRTLAKAGRAVTNSPRLRRLLYKLTRVSDYEKASPVMKKTMISLLADDERLPFERITAPVTLIWGAGDRTTPLSDARIMEKRLPKTSLRVIPDARHAPHFTGPDIVAGYVTEELSA